MVTPYKMMYDNKVTKYLTKIIIMLSTVITSFLFYQTAGNLRLNLNSPGSFCFSRFYKYLLTLFFYWSVPWLLLLTLGFAEKPYIREEFAFFLCTEGSILKAIESAVCNLSKFYWCSKRFSFFCYIWQRFIISSLL